MFNLALRFNLNGIVQNLTGEVRVEAQDEAAALDAFAASLIAAAPPQVVSTRFIPDKNAARRVVLL